MFDNGNFANGEVRYRDGSYYKGNMEEGKKNGDNAEFKFPDGDHFKGKFECDQFVQGSYETAKK